MRTVQQVFNIVIHHGLYRDHMCSALAAARGRHVITEDEYRKADKAIYSYMKKLDKNADHTAVTLRTLLARKGLPCSDKDLRKIYKDWVNRPSGMLALLTKVKARAKLIRTVRAPNKYLLKPSILGTVFFWKRVDAEIEGHIVGIRTLSDGTKEGQESYQPALYKTAYLVVTNIRQKPLLVSPEDLIW